MVGSQLAGMLARMKVTLALQDPELYREIKVEAARSGRAVRDIVEEALQEWLERREAAEDREAAGAALAEYEREGGVPAEEFFRRHVAELAERYGSGQQ